jgi:hypothetical protein
VIVCPEERWALFGFIAANAFEHRTTVADDVREDVNFRVVPGNQTAVMPNLLCRLQHVEIIAMCAAEREPPYVVGFAGAMASRFLRLTP